MYSLIGSARRFPAYFVVLGLCAAAHSQVFTDLRSAGFLHVVGVGSLVEGPVIIGEGTQALPIIRWTRRPAASDYLGRRFRRADGLTWKTCRRTPRSLWAALRDRVKIGIVILLIDGKWEVRYRKSPRTFEIRFGALAAASRLTARRGWIWCDCGIPMDAGNGGTADRRQVRRSGRPRSRTTNSSRLGDLSLNGSVIVGTNHWV